MSNIGNKQIMAKNLMRYIEKSGKTQKELSERVGVATSTFNDWVKAKKYPRIDKIEILADYFGILKSDLIEDKSEEHHEMQKKNDAMTDIIFKMRTDEDFFEAVSYMYTLDTEKLASVKQMLTFLK